MPVSTLRSCPSTPAATTAHDTQTGIAIILIRILILSSLSLTSLPKLISSSHQIISPLSLFFHVYTFQNAGWLFFQPDSGSLMCALSFRNLVIVSPSLLLVLLRTSLRNGRYASAVTRPGAENAGEDSLFEALKQKVLTPRLGPGVGRNPRIIGKGLREETRFL